MTNIWTDSFKELREPFFQIEDPYTLTEEKKEKEEKNEKEEKGEKEEKNEKEDEKEGKVKRWWDDDGDGIGYEKGEVSGKFKKKVNKEEVEALDEVSADLALRASKEAGKRAGILSGLSAGDPKVITKAKKKRAQSERLYTKQASRRLSSTNEERELYSKTKNTKKIDVSKGIKNSIKVNPSVNESIGIDEANTTMPPKGDAETKNVDVAAKRKSAQMQIRKELADVQLAKAKSQANQTTNESVIIYLQNRYNIFED